MTARRVVGVAITAAVLALHAGAAEPPRVETVEPRAYGYQVGDVLQRRVIVHTGSAWRLDPASLPNAGRRGKLIELRAVRTRTAGSGDDTRVEIDLDYQVFIAPTEVRTIEIAPMALKLLDGPREAPLRVEAWPVTVAPLVPLEVSPRRGLGDLQPDISPPLRDTSALHQRLAAYAAAGALLLIVLAVLHFGPPWRAARNRPFGRALRSLRRLPKTLPQAAWLEACRTVHEALNRTAGHVMFERDLDAFVQAHPAFAAVRDDIAGFLRQSRREFFDAQSTPQDHDTAPLVELARRCHEAERAGGRARTPRAAATQEAAS